jgi:serine/threonine-protein kinase
VTGQLVDGRYLLRERLGAGAFGVVHRAEQRALGITLREVALKTFDAGKLGVPPEELLHDALELVWIVEQCTDPALRALFVHCYDAGLALDGGEPRAFVAMELVAGDLDALIDGRPQPVALALAYGLEIARAVAFMHERGRLHRDLKPNNVLVTSDRRVKIGDFGLAVAASAVLRRAPSAGAIAYQAPESLALEEGTPSSDVYAIGLILYELLTGRLPYTDDVISAEHADVARLIECKLAPPEPPSARANVELRAHPDLEEVVLRCLRPPAERFRDAGALQAALQLVADGRAVAPARRATPREQVEDHLAHARGALARGDVDRAAALAEAAFAANRSIAPAAAVSAVYPLLVDVMLRLGRRDDAVRYADDGVRRRPCRDTYAAAASAHSGTPLAVSYRRQAREATA